MSQHCKHTTEQNSGTEPLVVSPSYVDDIRSRNIAWQIINVNFGISLVTLRPSIALQIECLCSPVC